MIATSPPNSLLLAGASVRSLAASALQSRIQPWCVDLFGDTDLVQMLEANGAPAPVRIEDFSLLPAAVAQWPSELPLVWTGGLEHRPSILSQIAAKRRVYGASPATAGKLSDLHQLSSWTDGTGVGTPQTLLEGTIPDETASVANWLVKPLRGAGGVGIRRWTAGNALRPGEVLQEQVGGVPVSAIAVSCQLGTRVLMSSLQISGESGLGGNDMAHCGNLGPLRLPDGTVDAIQAVAEQVGKTGLAGVFGLDFLLSTDSLTLIEVNPRITASHDIYDLTHTGPSVLTQHVNAQRGPGFSIGPPAAEPRGLGQLAKLVVYASQEIVLQDRDIQQLSEFATPVDGTCRRVTDPQALPHSWLADIPTAGLVTRGAPFCSVYHQISNHSNCVGEIARGERSGALDQLLRNYTGQRDLDTITAVVRWRSLFESIIAGDNAARRF